MNRRSFLTLDTTQVDNISLYRTPSPAYVTRNTNLTEQQPASRFLAQAALGPTLNDINDVTDNMGIEAWIDNQFSVPKLYVGRHRQSVSRRMMCCCSVQHHFVRRGGRQ